MTKEGYSGWPNEETWRANMEYLDSDDMDGTAKKIIEEEAGEEVWLDRHACHVTPPSEVARDILSRAKDRLVETVEQKLAESGCPDMESVDLGEIAECVVIDQSVTVVTVYGFKGKGGETAVEDRITAHGTRDSVIDRIREIVDGSMGMPGISEEFPEAGSLTKEKGDFLFTREYEDGTVASLDVKSFVWTML